MPDALEFLVYQHIRQREVVGLLQLVEQRVLHVAAGSVAVVALQGFAHLPAQIGEVFRTHSRRQGVVDLRRLHGF